MTKNTSSPRPSLTNARRSAPPPQVLRALWGAFCLIQPVLAGLSFVATSNVDLLTRLMDGQVDLTPFSQLLDGTYTVALAPLVLGVFSLISAAVIPAILAARLQPPPPKASAGAPLGGSTALPFTALIARFAMIEFCGLTGFIAAVTTGQPVLGLPSIAATLVGMLLARPS